MKILLIGKFYIEGFALHIEESLIAMGHQVVRFEPGVKYNSQGGLISKRWRQIKSTVHELSKQISVLQALQTRRLLNTAKQNDIELTIVCHDFLLPKEVRQLKKITKAPVVLWFPDHITSFGRSFFLNSDYDVLFFKDPYIVWILSRTLSRRICYLPECFNPNSLSEVKLSNEEYGIYACDITTAGNMYPYRGAFFSQLSDYNVKIWGNPPPLWMDTKGLDGMLQGKYVANEEKVKAFHVAKIVINNLYPAEIWGINVRAFEIAGAGGFQLIDRRPGITQLFKDGEELVSFSSMDDLKEKIDYYLKEEKQRNAIAERGRQRALREHTYEKRLNCMLKTIFEGEQGFPMPEEMDILNKAMDYRDHVAS